MALRTPPLYLQAGSHSAENDRLGLYGLVGTPGVGPLTQLKVSQSATPAMTVSIAAGWAWVLGSATNQGLYSVYNDAAYTLGPLNTAPTSNTRIDLVCVTIRDSAYSGSSNDVIFQIITGTAAASPVAPTLPTSSLSLATILVGTNVTTIVNANITDTRAYAALSMAASGTGGASYSDVLMLGGM
jgi:hypothetical protein